MTTYRISYRVSDLYTGEIEIPDHIHPDKRADYVRFHIDSVRNENRVSGTNDVEVCGGYMEKA